MIQVVNFVPNLTDVKELQEGMERRKKTVVRAESPLGAYQKLIVDLKLGPSVPYHYLFSMYNLFIFCRCFCLDLEKVQKKKETIENQDRKKMDIWRGCNTVFLTVRLKTIVLCLIAWLLVSSHRKINILFYRF